MLPYYHARSLENQRIKLRVSRYGKKHGITRTIEKGIYNSLKFCPKCNQFKELTDFIRYPKNSKRPTKRSSYCIDCRVLYNKRYHSPKANKKQWLSKKIRAYEMIQNEIKCVRCGCNDIRFLEINHKNGGGSREKRKVRIYQDVITGRRKTDDLELLCRPCNHIHYLEMKYNESISLKVVWSKE